MEGVTGRPIQSGHNRRRKSLVVDEIFHLSKPYKIITSSCFIEDKKPGELASMYPTVKGVHVSWKTCGGYYFTIPGTKHVWPICLHLPVVYGANVRRQIGQPQCLGMWFLLYLGKLFFFRPSMVIWTNRSSNPTSMVEAKVGCQNVRPEGFGCLKRCLADIQGHQNWDEIGRFGIWTTKNISKAPKLRRYDWMSRDGLPQNTAVLLYQLAWREHYLSLEFSNKNIDFLAGNFLFDRVWDLDTSGFPKCSMGLMYLDLFIYRIPYTYIYAIHLPSKPIQTCR